MEPWPVATYTPHSSNTRVFTGSGSGSSSGSNSSPALMDEDVIEISPPPLFPKSKTAKQKQVICHEVIDVDKYGDTDDLMIIDEKFVQSSKGKRSVSSYLSVLDRAPNDLVHLSKGVGPISHDVTIGDESSHGVNISNNCHVDLDCDGMKTDDECAMLQAYCDGMNIPPGVEADIPWWPSSEGSKNQAVSASSSDFIGPASIFDPGAPKRDDSQSSRIYKESSQTGIHGFLKSKKKPVSIPSSGPEPYNPWKPTPSHIHHEPGAWPDYSMLPSGTTKPSWMPYASNMVAGNPLPPGLPNFVNAKVLEPPYVSPVASHPFTGWNIPEADGPTFPTSDDFDDDFIGAFSYVQDPSVVLEQGIAAEISVPSDLASSNQKEDSESLIVKRLESFKKFDTVQDHSDHHYSSKNHSQPSKAWVKKIQEEWRILEKDLPDTIFVRVYETRMDLLRAVIIGADGTPYHDGIFFFDVYFPPSYPNVPPLVYYRSGGLRLNPNLYNCGKVCLSLLNTWSGGANEKWIPGLSTALQVLVSIQGLILNAKPYFNEPGYAGMAGTPTGEKRSEEYNENTFLLSLKTMLYSMRRPPKYFEDFVFGHFYKHAHDILVACKAYLDGAQVGTLVKGGIQDVDEGDKSCSNTFKMHLPVYINSLVKAFTKIGVKDCEKYSAPVNNNNAVAENTSSSSRKASTSSYRKRMTVKKTD